MARDGSGNYTRVAGPYTGGTTILKDNINDEHDDFATALSDSINKGGTKAFAANQPMGGFKLTGLAAGSSNGDSVRYEQLTALSGTYQPLDATLTALAALSTSASQYIRATGTDAFTMDSYATVLSNIGALASASYTAADVLSKLLTVDGAGSGLDADLLDGISSAGFNQPGVQHIPIMASAMTPRASDGAAPGTVTIGGSLTLPCLDFDQTTQEHVAFMLAMPKSWNESTIAFIPYWTASSGSGTVSWALEGVSLSNDDAISTSIGNDVASNDTLIATGDLHIGPQSGAITLANTPAEGDLIALNLRRVVANDTLTGDARLLGIILVITTNAANDA